MVRTEWHRRDRGWLIAAALLLVGCFASRAEALDFIDPSFTLAPRGNADYAAGSASQTSSRGEYANEPFRLEQLLPDSVAQNTDINAWGWFSYLHDCQDHSHNYWSTDVAIGVTQRFGNRVAATIDMHLLADNDETRGFLEQAYVTAEIFENSETLLTIGKFNAAFGIEGRNAWDRLGGTTSLIFGAQPQDLVGIMLTQPIGNSGWKIRPFLATQFDGRSNIDGPPGGGFLLEYAPSANLKFKLTQWIGPGLTPGEDAYGEYSNEAYQYWSNDYAIGNWYGPELFGSRAGVLYFTDANVTWHPRRDLTLTAEVLFAANGHSARHSGWSGALVMANYDVTDKFRVFGRSSFLNDNRGYVTWTNEKRYELSVGFAVQIVHGLELRTEYRHDFARSGDLDAVSAHLVFSY